MSVVATGFLKLRPGSNPPNNIKIMLSMLIIHSQQTCKVGTRILIYREKLNAGSDNPVKGAQLERAGIWI